MQTHYGHKIRGSNFHFVYSEASINKGNNLASAPTKCLSSVNYLMRTQYAQKFRIRIVPHLICQSFEVKMRSEVLVQDVIGLSSENAIDFLSVSFSKVLSRRSLQRSCHSFKRLFDAKPISDSQSHCCNRNIQSHLTKVERVGAHVILACVQ